MEGAGFALAQSLRQQMAPVVMVLPTPKVEASCQRNSLSFVDLLRPFCSLANVNVPVRTASEQPYRLQEFYVRMFYASEICQPQTETADLCLLEVVNDTNDHLSGEQQGDAQKSDFMKMRAMADARTPSFQKYSKEFMRTLAFSEHEAVDHPVACIQAVSSSDEHPISKFVELYNTEHLPALINEGVMDPKLLKLYVLVHDLQEGSVDRANEILLEMRSTFGVNNCRILCINSGSPESNEEVPNSSEDMWSSHLLRPMTPVNAQETDKLDRDQSRRMRGCYITKADMEELTDFVLDISVKHIIPTMELKIRTLYQQVAATRKGLKNQIKNLWWRKGKDEIPDVSNGPLYTYSSMESQIRVLADYAFMLRDYELALSNYRLLSSDYKIDKAWKRYAGVQEMIGLSLFMLDQSRRESELCMETAINYYQKSGTSSAKYATRCALWLAEMHKAKGQYREAAIVLFRSSTEEESLRAALLLEQAAYCYLRTAPPMLRKCGFHLVLAGNQYTNCGQRKLAMLVYRSALSIFRDQGWNYISDHVHFHLGRLCTLLENNAIAAQFFKKVIACSHQSPTNQAKYLAEFLSVIESDLKGAVLELDLPSVDLEHVHVHFEDQRTYASSAAASVPEEVWSSVEEGLVPAADKAVNWLDAKTAIAKIATDYNICVAGGEIGVDVEFRNPLQVTLDVSGVSLVCNFTAESTIEESGLQNAEGSKVDLSSSVDHLSLQDGQPGTNLEQHDLTLSEEAFTLKAGEELIVRLKVKPSRAGILRVMGVNWILSKIAHGRRDFAVLGRKNKLSRNNKRDEPPPHQRLKFRVLGHMPRLEVSLHEMPGRVNTGEVRRLVLELSNPSTATLKTIKFKTNHPLFLLVGDSGDLDQEFPGCLEVRRDTSRIEDAASIEEECSTSGFIFSFPEGTVLEGGSTLLWPLWLHASQAGTIILNTVIYYEPDKSIIGLRFRTVRITHSLQVIPSLRVGVQISPSPLHLEQFLLRLDIENEHSAESFWLRQVSCAGNQWSLESLPPPIVEASEESEGADSVRAAYLSASVCPSQLLPAGQNLSLFFKLLNVGSRKVPTAEGLTSNIKLGPPSSTEPLIDIASGPLLNFLLREKLHLRKPAHLSVPQQQAGSAAKADRKIVTASGSSGESLHDGGGVDVMLISEQQDGMSIEKRDSTVNDSLKVVVHDICQNSVQGSAPLVWVLEGPRCVEHNFEKDPFCEVSLTLTISNRSSFNASIKVETFDVKPMPLASSVPNMEKRVGWFPLAPSASPAVGEGTTATAALESGTSTTPATVATTNSDKENVCGMSPCGPYMWCNLRSTKISLLSAGASAQVPLCVAFFAPGIYDISRYQISWSLLDKVLETRTLPKSKSLVFGPQKLSKNTEITYASGFTPPADKQGGVSGSSSSGFKSSTSFGVGPGHPLLLSVLEVAL
ncbi:hypothetical protein Mapa_015527 [Marchantia paleacea]|nr:hypothetical protein Mapa_015527 [Marchantia paleacea]